MKDAIKKIREAEAEFKEKHAKLDNEIALFVVDQLMDAYVEKYQDEQQVLGLPEDWSRKIFWKTSTTSRRSRKPQQQQPGPFPCRPRKPFSANTTSTSSSTIPKPRARRW